MQTVDVVALAAKYDGELVGGRVIVRIGGQREYMTDVDASGPTLNMTGMSLEAGDIEVDMPDPELNLPEPPRRRKRAAAAPAADATPVDPAPANGITEDELNRALSA